VLLYCVPIGCIFVLVYMVDDELGMVFDNVHYIFSGNMVVLLFLVFVLSNVLVFCNSLYIQYGTSSV
jgi:hypothetical protein